jgi:diacylglycerol kinase family enzyme
MTRALLISNPFASRAHSRAVTTIRDILQGGGWKVDVHTTAGPGDARPVAEQARSAGYDVFVSHGGDGTAMQVAAGIVGTGITLGLLPGGTGNVLARNLNLPRSAASAARALLKARRLQIDIGVVERDNGPHYFAVVGGTGWDAQLMADTDLQAKRRWKFGAYLARAVTSLTTVRSVPHRVIVDGTPHDIRAAMVLVLNCGRLAPGFLNLRKGLDPDDGWLDIVALEADGAFESIGAVAELLLGGNDKGRRVWWSRGRTVRVEALDGAHRPVQLDGEVTGTTPFEARLLPGALPVFVGSDFRAHR